MPRAARTATGLIAVVMAVIVLAVIADGGASHHSHTILDEPAIITQAQYDAARIGTDEGVLKARLHSFGIAQHGSRTSLAQAFGDPPPGTACFFWKISSRPHAAARMCFTTTAERLAQKRERVVAG
jgi:hypothetical protein